jgi:predicted RNA binding protein YcfA (HicA-like mRNA interferase family)
MTDKLPRVTADDAIRALERAGFFLARQSASHKIFKNEEGTRITNPVSLRKDPPSKDPEKHPERRGFDRGRI